MKDSKKIYAKPYFDAFYQGNRTLLILALVLVILNFPVSLVGSWLLGRVIDVITSGDLQQLKDTLIFTVGFIIVAFLISVASYRARSRFICKALVQYKNLAFQKLSEKNISTFTRENTGSYISLLTNDVSSVEENYLRKSFLLLHYVLVFIGTLVMMFWYSPILTFATVFLAFLPMTASVFMGKEMAVREKEVSDRNEGFVAQLQDLLSGFSVIKSFKAEKEAWQMFAAASQEVEEKKFRRYWWECLLTAVSQNLCADILQFGIFLAGAYLAVRGDITAGTVLIFVNLCNYIIMPVNIVPQYWASRKGARGLIEKLAEITQENRVSAGDRIKPALEKAIVFEHVAFGYEPDQPVLQNINLRLEAGKKYALVGPSGSGKSTLLNLLMGACSGYSGHISVDGKELREVDTDSLYDLISLIDQNVFLFNDTIRRNITMFRDFPEEETDRAIRHSGLSRLVEERGGDYRCGENGAGLSGGERQRVSIARCLLRGTPVLLLDEATASLDNQTAFAVTDAILKLDGLTRLVVTHRLDDVLLEQYDEIIVLCNGTVYERGSFHELLEKKAYFYSLYHVTNG